LKRSLGVNFSRSGEINFCLPPSGDVLLAFTRPWFEKMEKIGREVDLALTGGT